jgi:prepilin-type N-terminal cleavage/methylation domain-containing protein
MLQRIRKLMAHEGGFTLIELLIVIIILGILAAIVVFAVSGITDRGTKSACKADVESVLVASEAYFAQNGTYATSMGQLVSGGFLHNVPNSTNYTINFGGGGAVSNTVTSNLAGCP